MKEYVSIDLKGLVPVSPFLSASMPVMVPRFLVEGHEAGDYNLEHCSLMRMGENMRKRFIVSFLLLQSAVLGISYMAAATPELVEYEEIGRKFSLSDDFRPYVEKRQLVRRLSAQSDNVGNIIDQLRSEADTISPEFLFDLARLVFPQNKEEAVHWFMLAKWRTQLDAAHCEDAAWAQSYAQAIVSFAPNVKAYINEDPTRMVSAGRRILSEGSHKKGQASPWWICRQSVKLQDHLMFGKSIDDYKVFSDREGWSEKYNELLAAFELDLDLIEGKGRDQVTHLKEWLVPTQIAEDRNINYVRWVDNERIIYSQGTYAGYNIWLWNGTGREKLDGDMGASPELCVASDYIHYRKQERRKIANGRSKNVDVYFAGRLGEVKKIGSWPGQLSGQQNEFLPGTEAWPTTRDGSKPKLHKASARRNLSAISCKWLMSEELTQEHYKPQLWADLVKWPGMLGWDGVVHSQNKGQGQRPGLYYYSKEDLFVRKKLVPRKLLDQGMAVSCMKYIPHLDAIHLNACRLMFVTGVSKDKRVSGVERRMIAEYMRNTTLLRWNDGQPVIEQQPLELLLEEKWYTTSLLTKRGLVRAIGTLQTIKGDKPAGLYWYKDNGNIVRIWKGKANQADVAPDGCQLAFTGSRQEGHKTFDRLYTVDICKALPQAD